MNVVVKLRNGVPVVGPNRKENTNRRNDSIQAPLFAMQLNEWTRIKDAGPANQSVGIGAFLICGANDLKILNLHREVTIPHDVSGKVLQYGFEAIIVTVFGQLVVIGRIR